MLRHKTKTLLPVFVLIGGCTPAATPDPPTEAPGRGVEPSIESRSAYVPLRPTGTAPAHAPATPSAAQMRAAIQARLGDNGIEVAVADRVVTFTGTVESLYAAEQAVDIAETTRGVRSVVNRLRVLAPEVPDERLARQVQNALAANVSTEATDVTVDVTNGKVLLRGRVSSWIEKEIAAQEAKTVTGVVEVIDELTVDWGEPGADGEIHADVSQSLARDARIDARRIDVDVDDGVVRLDGVVGSLAEKRAAWRAAWVAGVIDVNENPLAVAPSTTDELQRFRAPRPTAETTERAVKAALESDPRVAASRVRVSVEDGLATLSGTVRTLMAKRAALSDAENTIGVLAVDDRMRVEPSKRSDRVLEQRLRSRFADHALLHAHGIDVDVQRNGTARLIGTVGSDFARRRAEDVAQNLPGVVAVENDLRVVSTRQPTPSDAELERLVGRSLLFSPWVDASQITVSATDAVVTLDGVVSSLAAERDALQRARELAGTVVDQVKVER